MSINTPTKSWMTKKDPTIIDGPYKGLGGSGRVWKGPYGLKRGTDDNKRVASVNKGVIIRGL